MERREFIQQSSGLALASTLGTVAAVLSQPAAAQNAPGWNKAAFEAKTLADVVKALGASGATESKDVLLQAPEIAENGNVVRVGGQSTMPGTTHIALVVEKNPNALAALFEVPQGSDANFATNIKMGQTSRVIALARVGDHFYYAAKEVKVTIGGCGG